MLILWIRGCAMTGHPRRRGEHAAGMATDDNTLGSSPQARGTSTDTPRADAESRVIPAGAGNIISFTLLGGVTGGHPRRRGEHLNELERDRVAAGSSPQARGTSLVSAPPAIKEGVIPAGAGNISCAYPTKQAPTGHPRRRGEHAGLLVLPIHGLGSSPQARGTSGSIAVDRH